jgi:hypothetical protein
MASGTEWDLDQLRKTITKANPEVLKTGRMSVQNQLGIRQQMNALLAKNEMVSHDVMKRGASRRFMEVEKIPKHKNWAAYHNSGTGRIVLGDNTWSNLATWSVNPKADATALRTLIHETVHGHSPMVHQSLYRGIGKKVEEATTDLAARGLMRQIGQENFRGSYTGWTKVVTRVTRESISFGTKTSTGTIASFPARANRLRTITVARDAAEQASINMRKVTKRFRSGNSYAKHFAESVDWPTEIFAGMAEKQAAALRKKMVNKLTRDLIKYWEDAPMW